MMKEVESQKLQCEANDTAAYQTASSARTASNSQLQRVKKDLAIQAIAGLIHDSSLYIDGIPKS